MVKRVLKPRNGETSIKDEPDRRSPLRDVENEIDYKKKRKISDVEEEEVSEFEEDEVSELEKRRMQNVYEKNELLKQLGIFKAVDELNKLSSAATKRIEQERKKNKEERERFKRLQPLQPTRRSARVAGQPTVHYDQESLVAHVEESLLKEKEKEQEKEREFLFDPEPMRPLSEDQDEDEVKTSLNELLPYLQASGSTKATSEVSLDRYKSELKKLKLAPEKVMKIGKQKLYTLTVHPSVTKTLVITGGDQGVVGFWDASRSDDSAVELFSPLDAPVYCVSVCNRNPSLVYCTAIDGVTRRCDLEKLQFQDIHVNTGKNGHTVHHSQLSPHVLMIACGDGSVKLVDVREPGKEAKAFYCHEQSVRTVQRHPLKEEVFVTSSRTCSVAIWDIRSAPRRKPLVNLSHPKALKSAFFSPGGGLLLTACNDNRLRVYETGYMDGPLKVVMNTGHNLFTGRFIRPFKPVWHPLRDDVFVIGSLEAQRKVDIYGIHGLRIHALQSPHLSTILSNCMFHPSRDIVVGHNSSGRVHVFERD